MNEVLTPAQVASRVAGFRSTGVAHRDTVGNGGSCPQPSNPGSPSQSNPGSPSQSDPGNPGTCSAPLWTVSGQYTGGTTVRWERSANGNPNGPKSGDGVHLWRARWWTQGSEPGWTAQWQDLGRC